MIFGRRYTKKGKPVVKGTSTVDGGTLPKVSDAEFVRSDNVIVMGICVDCNEYSELFKVFNVFNDEKHVCTKCLSEYAQHLGLKRRSPHSFSEVF